MKGEPIEHSGCTGTPMTFPLQNANWYGGRGGHIGFSPILPQDGTKALAQFQRTYARYKEYGMDYQGSFAFGERHLINVNAMIIDKDDERRWRRSIPSSAPWWLTPRRNGYGEYRTHLDYMDLVAGTYDWNGDALRKLNENCEECARSQWHPRARQERYLARQAGRGAQVMNLKIASGMLAMAILLLCATQASSQAGADVVAAQPAQRGGAAPMPKPVTVSSRPNATGGEKAYLEKCAMCHAPPGMGVGLLARRVDEPNLEKRDNLTAEYVMVFARNGIGNMPAISRGEVSDEELRAIAEYLAAGPHEVGQ